jgi:hypothetical protein
VFSLPEAGDTRLAPGIPNVPAGTMFGIDINSSQAARSPTSRSGS